ncbi:hypothetical protein TRICI_004024 [Trichomonascus ciferrii]|uniref:Folliculin-interacting protein N-terminal domain-containing protein n=1 Tax=Trichomonascus ciferrii TaxID=44093 RepID=A0A642V8A6_9ASCO|nr:hypothetical protein TRICI_004024 [Trichomonascus ciferrii]
MLGRLFSSSLGGGSSSHSTSGTEGGSHPGAPISMLEEADTRSLLYGSAVVKSKADLKIEPARDIRVVVISDLQFLDDFLFDSNCSQESQSSSNRPFPPLVRAASYMGPEHQQRAASTTPSPPPPSPGGSNGPEPLPLTLLREVLFGPTPIRFHSSVMKLHPFPNANSSRRTWLVSKMFKIGQNDLLDSVPTKFVSEYKSAPTTTNPLASPNNREEPASSPVSFQWNGNEEDDDDDVGDNGDDEDEDEEDNYLSGSIMDTANTWNPRNSVNYSLTPPMPQDVGCGICVFFNMPSDSNTMLTNHWEELSYALADLQKVIFNRLVEILPGVLREYQANRRGRGSAINTRKYSGLCDSDEGIRHAVDFFRTRFYGVVRIPRVICGQNRWSELFQEVKWACQSLDQQQDDFVSSIISSFIQCNQKLISQSRKDRHKNGDDTPPTRTVLVCSNRITARRLIFILTSLINDVSTKLWNKKMSKVNNQLAVEDTYDDDDSAGPSKAMSSTSSSPASRSHAVFSSTEGGWEIPASSTRTSESSSTCTMPHVIRPSFSSSSLSNSLSSPSHQARMRYPSFEGLRKSFGSSSGGGGATGAGGSSNSLFSSLWSSGSTMAGASFTSNDSFLDDLGPTHNNAYDDLPNSLPTAGDGNGRPKLDRYNSSERTATTLGPFNNRMTRTQTSDSISSSFSDFQPPPESPKENNTNTNGINYRFVQQGDVDVLEVDPLDTSDPALAQPIILPPIAGHIPDFHPDFGIQAVPLNRDLEEKIARAMVRDADVIPIPKWASQAKSEQRPNDTESSVNNIDEPTPSDEPVTLSRSLIVNLKKREIYEWALTRQCSSNGCRQELVRRKLYSGRRPQGEYASLAPQVSTILREIIDNSKGDNIHALKKAYKSRFNLS